MGNIKKIVYTSILSVVILTSVFTAMVTIGVFDNLKFYAVVSSSMQPSIKKGSIVVVEDNDKYSINDVVSFNSEDYGNAVITHRIVGIEYLERANIYITKGDANPKSDRDRLSEGNIIGKVIFIIPLVGYLTTYARTQLGMIFLIVVPCTIIIINEFSKIQKEIKNLKGRNGILSKLFNLKNILIFMLLLMLFSTKNTITRLNDYSVVRSKFTASIISLEKGKKDPEMLFYENDEVTEVGFVLNNVSEYDQINYEITYEKEGGVMQGITGNIDNSQELDTILREHIILGTCSSGGTCVYDAGIERIDLKVDLKKDTDPEITLEDFLII